VAKDQWAQWLLTRRDGESAELRARFAPELAWFRDGVLDRADLRPDDVVLDVGCGTGLIGFGALSRLGPDGRVIFSDVSEDLLDECRRTAAGDPRCTFVRASADDLAGVANASVDVVTTRSVLIYLNRKAAAFAEFARVLRPGGRLSVFEPINRFAAQHRPDHLFGVGGLPGDLARKIRGAFADPAAMLDFDERDLMDLADDAGFEEVHLNYEAAIESGKPVWGVCDWDVLLKSSGNPKIPALREAMDEALTTAEFERFAAHPRPLVEQGRRRGRTAAHAYLWAVK
jgi:arsenite methyltransferase